ncbi:MAG: hypothetical protein ACLUD2_03180 [Clostridium sp.]
MFPHLASSNEIAVERHHQLNLFNLLVVCGCCVHRRPFALSCAGIAGFLTVVAVVLFLMIFRIVYRQTWCFLLVLLLRS